MSTTNRRVRGVRVRFDRPAGRYAAVVAAAACAALAVTACGSSSSSSSSGSSSKSASVNFGTVTSAQAAGGMSALVAAAKKEGTLNVIALPSRLGQLRHGDLGLHRHVRDQGQQRSPERSSAQEIQAIKTCRGELHAPDVVDVGQSFAVADADLFAPYKVATWNDIPAINKDANGDWYNDYGGYVSFGCNLSDRHELPDHLG